MKNCAFKVGDIVWHRKYDFFGKVKSTSAKLDRFNFTIKIIGKISDPMAQLLFDNNLTVAELEKTNWIVSNQYFIKVDDCSEKARLFLKLKYFIGE